MIRKEVLLLIPKISTEINSITKINEYPIRLISIYLEKSTLFVFIYFISLCFNINYIFSANTIVQGIGDSTAITFPKCFSTNVINDDLDQ